MDSRTTIECLGKELRIMESWSCNVVLWLEIIVFSCFLFCFLLRVNELPVFKIGKAIVPRIVSTNLGVCNMYSNYNLDDC